MAEMRDFVQAREPGLSVLGALFNLMKWPLEVLIVNPLATDRVGSRKEVTIKVQAALITATGNLIVIHLSRSVDVGMPVRISRAKLIPVRAAVLGRPSTQRRH
ncbi:unnamed protein product [Schistocephalus solidus]|uniref:Transposase n=1 Tax=Schistocephalus solidus TaxID=70667 RepID=A0A183SNI3_SCHSO|nr:unnamed protein product [Schistocephalus solidus]